MKNIANADRPKDRKSTRLNSSHLYISYAVFCLKKKEETYSTPLERWDRTPFAPGQHDSRAALTRPERKGRRRNPDRRGRPPCVFLFCFKEQASALQSPLPLLCRLLL